MAKILIVEDEIGLRETLVEELNDEGHLTLEAGNGREGLEQLAADVPDMILSDITMPEMNGYQFFRSVKEKFPEHEFTPFIFLSALSDRDDQLKGLRLGVDDYLTKPVDFDLLMTKIELNLRRHKAQVKRSSPADTSGSETSTGEQDKRTPIEKLAAIAQRRNGRIMLGKIEAADPELLETQFGVDWKAAAEQFQKAAVIALKEQLGPGDVIHSLPPKDVLICFADLTELDQVETRLGELRDTIWEALFSKCNEEELVAVKAVSGVVTLDANGVIDDESVFADLDHRLMEEKQASYDERKNQLIDNHRSKSLFALKLLTPTSAPSKIKMLNFEKAVLLENRRLINEGHHNTDFLIELHACLFKRLAEKKAYREAFSKGAMLLPIRFELADDAGARDHITTLCQNLKEALGATIIVELIDTPDRFHSHIEALSPLPIGGQVHFVELRRLEQLGSLEIGQLKELGVAFFSMRFQHAIRQEPAVLRDLIKTFESNGVKFYIKEIPDGKLSEAQQYGAHLYSMH